MLDAGKTGFDGGAIGKRGGQIFGQLPRACARGAAIDTGDQAAGPPPTLRFENLETGASRCIHREVGSAAACDRGQEEGQRAASCMLEIGDQPGRCSKHGAGEVAQSIERGDLVDRLEAGFAVFAAEITARPGDDVGWGIRPVIGGEQLACAQSR